jgi:hypothetical protein
MMPCHKQSCWLTIITGVAAATNSSCARCAAAHPKHPFQWKECMPKRAECVPPQGVELIVVRGTGNKFFAEDVLDQLSYFAAGSASARDACADASTWRWTEARSVAFVPPATVAATPRPLFALPTGPRAREAYVAILRHPVLRVASCVQIKSSTRLQCARIRMF